MTWKSKSPYRKAIKKLSKRTFCKTESEVEMEQNIHENINDGLISSSEDDILCRTLRSLSCFAEKDTDVAREDND